jgi:predicted PurR-regulated permease PerM
MAEPTDRQRVNVLFFYGAVLLLGWLFFRIIEPFLVEIAWASVLAICFEPAHAALARRFGPTRAAVVSTLIVTVLIVGPGLLVASALVAEATHAVNDVQSLLEREGAARARDAWEWARGHVPFLPSAQEVIARVTESMGGLAARVAAQAGGVLKNVASFLFSLVITLFVLFFFLRDGAAVRRVVDRTLPFPPAQRRHLIEQTQDLVSASVIATLVIAVIQGSLGGVAFALLGLRSPVVWGVVMGVASFIPFVGTGLVWLPAALWLLATGHVLQGVVLLGVGALISNVDNVVRPLLLSGKSTMNGLLVFLSLMGGVSAFGFIGIVLGPLVAATVVALLDTYTERPDEPETVADASAPAPAAEPAPAAPPPEAPPPAPAASA